MFRIAIISFLAFFILSTATSQEKFVVSGNIKDASTGEDLIGATIIVDGMTSTGTVSNSYDFYSEWIFTKWNYQG